MTSTRGRWSDPGVPHKGWRWVGSTDLGEPSQLCEMCATQQIRYVHHLVHELAPHELDVGCVCAEHLTADYAALSAAEARLRARDDRGRRWTRAPAWAQNARGNWTRRGDRPGEAMTAYAQGSRWRWVWSLGEQQRFSERSYALAHEARRALYDWLYPAVEKP